MEPRDTRGRGLLSVWLCRLRSLQCPEAGVAVGLSVLRGGRAEPGCCTQSAQDSPGWAEGRRWGKGRGVHRAVTAWMGW